MKLYIVGVLLAVVAFTSGCATRTSLSTSTFNPRLIYALGQSQTNVTIEHFEPFTSGEWQVQAICILRTVHKDDEGIPAETYRIFAKSENKMEAMLEFGSVPSNWRPSYTVEMPEDKGWHGTFLESRLRPWPPRVLDINDIELAHPLPGSLKALLDRLSQGELRKAKVAFSVKA